MTITMAYFFQRKSFIQIVNCLVIIETSVSRIQIASDIAIIFNF